MRSLAITALLVGCYAPTPQPGASCATSPCPSGLVCSPATETCELTAIDAATPIDTTMADAKDIDALVVDAPHDSAIAVGPRLRQVAHAHLASSPTLSVAFPDAPGAGHMIVMVGDNINGPLNSVSGGGVTNWKRASQSLVWQNLEIWYGPTDGTNDPVVIERVGSTDTTTMQISEWSGLMTNAPVNAHPNDGTTSPATVTGNVANAGDLVIFGVSNIQPNTFGALAPGTWTAVDVYSTLQTSQGTWYQLATATGTVTPSVDVTALEWDAGIAIFRAL